MQNIFLKFVFFSAFFALVAFFQTDLLAAPPTRYGFSGSKEGPEIAPGRPIRSIGGVVVSEERDKFCFAVIKNLRNNPTLSELPLGNVAGNLDEAAFAAAYDTHKDRLIKLSLKRLGFVSNNISLENRSFIVFDKKNSTRADYTDLSSPNTFQETDLINFFFFKKDELELIPGEQPIWEERNALSEASSDLKKFFEFSDKLGTFENMFPPRNNNAGGSGPHFSASGSFGGRYNFYISSTDNFNITGNNIRIVTDACGNINISGRGSAFKNSAANYASENWDSVINKTINGNASGNMCTFTSCTINGNASGNMCTFTSCIINGKCSGMGCDFINCKYPRS